MAGGSKRPDFLLSLDGEQFYLEAVRVGRKPAELAKERRLNEVYRVLEEMRVEDFARVATLDGWHQPTCYARTEGRGASHLARPSQPRPGS